MSEQPVILCVDGEKSVLRSLVEQLERGLDEAFHIEWAERGEEAVRHLDRFLEKEIPVPVVITDLVLPGMSGNELLAHVHERSPETRNIVLTAKADAGALADAVNRASLHHVLPKPCDGEALLKTVREAAEMYFTAIEVIDLNQELSDQSDTLAKLVAGLVHESATPLGAICSSATLLQQSVARLDGEPDPEKVKRFTSRAGQMAETINQGAERLTTLMDRLEAFVHLDESEPTPTDALALLHDAVMLVRSTVREAIAIDYQRDEVVAMLTCHPARLNRVFVKLLQNAADAIPEAGKIAVNARCKGGQLTITIKDTGAGIPEERLGRLFEPMLTQSGKSPVRLRMGLASCRNVVRYLRGKLHLFSVEGHGTTAVITLPVDTKAQA